MPLWDFFQMIRAILQTQNGSVHDVVCSYSDSLLQKSVTVMDFFYESSSKVSLLYTAKKLKLHAFNDILCLMTQLYQQYIVFSCLPSFSCRSTLCNDVTSGSSSLNTAEVVLSYHIHKTAGPITVFCFFSMSSTNPIFLTVSREHSVLPGMTSGRLNTMKVILCFVWNWQLHLIIQSLLLYFILDWKRFILNVSWSSVWM